MIASVERRFGRVNRLPLPIEWLSDKCEELERRRFASQAEAKIACFSFIEGWYNPARLHSALGYRSPMAYEHAMEVQPTEA